MLLYWIFSPFHVSIIGWAFTEIHAHCVNFRKCVLFKYRDGRMGEGVNVLVGFSVCICVWVGKCRKLEWKAVSESSRFKIPETLVVTLEV